MEITKKLSRYWGRAREIPKSFPAIRDEDGKPQKLFPLFGNGNSRHSCQELYRSGNSRLCLILFHPLSSSFIFFHPILSSFILFHPLSSSFILFHPLSSSFIIFHPLSSSFIISNSLLSSFISKSTTLLQLQTSFFLSLQLHANQGPQRVTPRPLLWLKGKGYGKTTSRRTSLRKLRKPQRPRPAPSCPTTRTCLRRPKWNKKIIPQVRSKASSSHHQAK